jgi:ATP-binding cassette subfamily F protein 3
MVFISHDVYFIRTLANHVVHVNAGRLTHYPGGYGYYLEKTKALSARAALTATGRDALSVSASLRPDQARIQADRKASLASLRKEQKRLEAEQRQARSRARQALQRIVAELEREIHELEQRHAALTTELEQPETYRQPGRPVEINRELVTVQHRLRELNPEWEKQAERLAELD